MWWMEICLGVFTKRKVETSLRPLAKKTKKNDEKKQVSFCWLKKTLVFTTFLKVRETLWAWFIESHGSSTEKNKTHCLNLELITSLLQLLLVREFCSFSVACLNLPGPCDEECALRETIHTLKLRVPHLLLQQHRKGFVEPIFLDFSTTFFFFSIIGVCHSNQIKRNDQQNTRVNTHSRSKWPKIFSLDLHSQLHCFTW